jgi:zinc transport system substrate-binding protein
MPRIPVAALLTLALAAGCAGCGSRAAASGFAGGRLLVVTAFYPLQFLSQRIGGPAVTVTNLTKPGAEPHDVELNPRQVARIADAGVAVRLSGFQPAVDAAIDQEAAGRSFDAGSVVELLPLSGEEEHGHGTDPHVWLDPVRFAAIADRLGERLGAADPAHAADYTARAAALHAELDGLDDEFARALAACRPTATASPRSASPASPPRMSRRRSGWPGWRPRPGAPAPPRSSSRRWSAPRWRTPSHVRSAPGPRCSTRSRGRVRPATTSP